MIDSLDIIIKVLEMTVILLQDFLSNAILNERINRRFFKEFRVKIV